MCKGIGAVQMLTAITTQSIMFEGSRLACTSTQSEQSNRLNQLNHDRHCVAPFIGLAYDVMMMS